VVRSGPQLVLVSGRSGKRSAGSLTDSNGGMSMARKDRSDIRIRAFEKKHGLPAGTVRNQDGRDTRSDKKLASVRKEAVRKVG
jgi:hypothetical protein